VFSGYLTRNLRHTKYKNITPHIANENTPLSINVHSETLHGWRVGPELKCMAVKYPLMARPAYKGKAVLVLN
jgi:hypothetical protein